MRREGLRVEIRAIRRVICRTQGPWIRVLESVYTRRWHSLVVNAEFLPFCFRSCHSTKLATMPYDESLCAQNR